MIEATSRFPIFLYDSEPIDQPIQLKLIVCIEQQIKQHAGLNQTNVLKFRKDEIIIKYNQGHRQVYLTPKKSSSFRIQQTCEVLFSGKVQQLQDFQGIVTELLLTAYKFSRKTSKSSQIKIKIKNMSEFMMQIVELVKAKNHSRQLANGRGDIEGAPQYFVKQIQRIKNQYNLKTTIFRGDQLIKQGFRLLHAVGRASCRQPIFANISYNGNKKSDKYVAFVGKGVCFDSGGLDIKSHQGMKIMFLDKQGASSVIAAFQQIVKQNLQVNLTCSVGMVQNLIGSRSYRPSDIIKSRKGLTVKIQDTDAQGRLVLADAMNWTQQNFKTDILIQLSTLTYSNIAALGQKYAGMFSNSEELSEKLFELGKKTHQRVWRMPVDQQHHEMLQCQDADLMSDTLDIWAPGGSIGAAFLQNFVQKGTKWVHLDIGGVGISKQIGTGWGTILLIQLMRNLSK